MVYEGFESHHLYARVTEFGICTRLRTVVLRVRIPPPAFRETDKAKAHETG